MTEREAKINEFEVELVGKMKETDTRLSKKAKEQDM